MFHALSWFVVLGLLALWSLGAWAFHALAVWAVSQSGAWSGAAAGIEGLALPAWLAPWVPSGLLEAATALMAGLAPAFDALLQALPALAGVLTVLTWVIWAGGAVLLIGLGAGLHLLIAMLRRRSGDASSLPRPQTAA